LRGLRKFSTEQWTTLVAATNQPHEEASGTFHVPGALGFHQSVPYRTSSTAYSADNTRQMSQTTGGWTASRKRLHYLFCVIGKIRKDESIDFMVFRRTDVNGGCK